VTLISFEIASFRRFQEVGEKLVNPLPLSPPVCPQRSGVDPVPPCRERARADWAHQRKWGKFAPEKGGPPMAFKAPKATREQRACSFGKAVFLPRELGAVTRGIRPWCPGGPLFILFNLLRAQESFFRIRYRTGPEKRKPAVLRDNRRFDPRAAAR